VVALPAVEPAVARPKIAFVFGGQGPQWWAMGRQLYKREKIVRELWEKCDAVCRQLGGPNLLDALLTTEAESHLMRTEFAQPALFALQAGRTELWRAWGILPDVMSDTVGEMAAAWAAACSIWNRSCAVIAKVVGRLRCRWRMLAAAYPPTIEGGGKIRRKSGGRCDQRARQIAPRK
jgi:acyl transferase domain-containing protein